MPLVRWTNGFMLCAYSGASSNHIKYGYFFHYFLLRSFTLTFPKNLCQRLDQTLRQHNLAKGHRHAMVNWPCSHYRHPPCLQWTLLNLRDTNQGCAACLHVSVQWITEVIDLNELKRFHSPLEPTSKACMDQQEHTTNGDHSRNNNFVRAFSPILLFDVFASNFSLIHGAKEHGHMLVNWASGYHSYFIFCLNSLLIVSPSYLDPLSKPKWKQVSFA